MTLADLRTQFPHTAETIYLNHAATSPLSTPVIAAMHAYLDERHRTHIENYFDFQHTIAAGRERFAQMIGATRDRVAYAPNTSMALNVLAQGFPWQTGDRIAIPACEFPANVYPFMNLQDKGVEIDWIPHHDGTFSLDDIAATITPRTRVLTLSWVQFLSGFKADLDAIGQLCHAHDVLFCVDAIQGLGALSIGQAVSAGHVDFLACGSHKWLMAPQGIGFLYVTKDLQAQLAPPFAGWLSAPVDWDRFFDYDLTFHPTARRFRTGTLNAVGIAGLHAAMRLYLEAGPAWCETQVLDRVQQLDDGLKHLGFERYGPEDPAHQSGIVTVRHPQPEALFAHLQDQNIIIALRNQMLRFAPTYYNAPEEIERVLDAIRVFETGRVAVA